jgi:orotidine-5'-phosphate decarboxylase
VDLLTVHAIGGEPMIHAAVEATAGTSTGIGAEGINLSNAVRRLAGIASKAGARGVVCAGAEAEGVRAAHRDTLGILVPGLRPAGTESHDQSRTSTPEQLRAVGADWTVVGRAVTAAMDPAKAYSEILEELSGK